MAPLISYSIKLLLDVVGPLVLNRIKRSIEEAGGKFSSDWRRTHYVRREFKRAMQEEKPLLHVPRSTRNFLIELLVLDWKKRSGFPLMIAGLATPVDPTDAAGA